jgi:hypothetical protein
MELSRSSKTLEKRDSRRLGLWLEIFSMVAILIRLEIRHVSYSGYYHSPACRQAGFQALMTKL